MLREKQIETKIVEAIAALEPLAGAQVVGSRSVVTIEESSAPVFVAVALGLRQHDNFTLPTVNMPGVVSITTRSEMDGDHEAIVEAIAELFTGWHLDAEAMTEALSVDGVFYAAGLRMDGSSGKSFADNRAAWAEEITFTIRGTLLTTNTQN